MTTIVFTLLGLALLISSIFGHSFVMVSGLRSSLISWWSESLRLSEILRLPETRRSQSLCK